MYGSILKGRKFKGGRCIMGKVNVWKKGREGGWGVIRVVYKGGELWIDERRLWLGSNDDEWR